MSYLDCIVGDFDTEGQLVALGAKVKIQVRPDGLERACSFEPHLDLVTVEQLRDACRRYAARKTTVPGSYANRHYIETGHAFGFGCCLGTEAA